ncbi:Hypothetical protein A7982_08678 [Minicystis rosea]|nr:Hypothetical protein A7982_08678 [Minicystis rosea]
MKSIMLWTGLVAMLACFGCSVEAGVDVGVGGNGGSIGCEPLSCGDALASGLNTEGAALCDGPSDSAYADLYSCACNGACADVCSDNLCQDLGETGDCGDCLNDVCGPEHDVCANN